MYEILSRSPIFKGVKPKEVQQLLKRVKTQIKHYKKGQNIAFSGESCEELLLLVEGVVTGEMLDYSGKTVQVGTIKAPNPLAPAFLFGKNHRFPVDAVAIKNVKLLAIPKHSLIYLMQLNPDVLTNYLDVISNRTHFLTDRLWFMSFKTIKEKLAHYILKLTQGETTQVTLPKNQQELSKFFGVSRPSLSRVVGELEREGILEINRKEVKIINLEKLKALVD